MSVFHCGVSEPPTAMKPATRGLSTRSSTRKGTAGSPPACSMRTSSSMIAASAFGPEQPVAEQLQHAPATVREMIGVLTIEGVGLDEPLPVPPRVVGLGSVRPARQVQLLEPHELDLGARRLGGAQRGDQEDLGAAAQLAAPEAENLATQHPHTVYT